MGHAITEDEAPSKWCPQSLVARHVGGGQQDDDLGQAIPPAVAVTNRQPGSRDPFDGSHCVGSMCMHWSWLEGTGRGPSKKGYCGLSGKPT
jgi:hypothetical protein